MVLPVRKRIKWKQVGTSVALIVASVLTTAGVCPDPVSADLETVYTAFELDGGTSSFVGDTLTLQIDAQDQNDNNVANTESEWTLIGSAVKLIEGSSNKFDEKRAVLLQEGTATITATAGIGKMVSGATPVATHTITVVGKPARIVFMNVPRPLEVGQQQKVWAQLQDAQGRKIDSPKMTVLKDIQHAGLITETTKGDSVLVTGVAPGTVTVRLTLSAASMTYAGLTGPPISADTIFTVVGAPHNISFSPANHQLIVGQSGQVTMLSTDAASNLLPGVTYEVTSLTPTVVSVSNVAGGSFTVNAVSNGSEPTAAGKISVKAIRGTSSVTKEFDVTVHTRVASVSVAPSPVRVNVGLQQPLSPVVTFKPGAPQTPATAITWESSNNAKATVSNQGVVTGVANSGSSRVLITAIVEGVRSAPAEVQVGPFGMGFVPAAVNVAVGAFRTLVLEERDSSGVAISGVNVPNTGVDFSVAMVNIATVSTAGVVTCHLPGTTMISALLKNTSMQAGTTVTCGNVTPVASMILDPVEYTTIVGGNTQFQARLLDAQGNETSAASGFHVTYTVTTSAVAELVGLATSGLVLGKVPGTTTVNAYYTPIAGGTPVLSAQSTLRVGSATAGQVASVRITQTHLLASPGVSQGLTAIAYDLNGNVVNGVNFMWSKLVATNQVTVGPTSGVVTANSTGGNTIFASAIMPGDVAGPTGVTAVTVRSAGAVQATVQKPGDIPAAGATVRAWMGGNVMVTGIVPVNSPTPGRVYVPGLLAGTYTITVSLPGYQVRKFENVVVTAEQVLVLNGGQPIVLQQQ